MTKRLNKEEKTLLDAYDSDKWKSIENGEEQINKFQDIAQRSLKKDKRINIRINNNDLLELKRKAMHEGIPYQTFIRSILHKFINGKIVEESK
jgi:predicted DNA binding CopG/RHH family protein